MTPTDRKIHRFNARVAATLRRLAQDAPAAKQDPNKTMMGQWSDTDRKQAQKVVTDVKTSLAALKDNTEKLLATVDPLSTYTDKVDPASVKQIGQLVQFVATTKPVVAKLSTLLGTMTTALNAINTGLKTVS